MTLEIILAGHRLTAADSLGIIYRTGPFVVRLRTDIPELIDLLNRFYGACWASREPAVAHFLVEVRRVPRLRGHWRPQIQFQLDELNPFEPYPLNHSFPFLEWGLNWSIGTRAHQYLMLHAGALARGDLALLLPAMPGSGKSTLSAALAYRGWRFLSDEFGLIEPATGRIHPLPRAVPLKNRSIPVIRDYLPEAYLGPVFPKTRKGDVAHLRPPLESIERQSECATPRWVVFPRFIDGLTKPRLSALDKSVGFNRLAQNSFNYRLLGEIGFRTLTGLIRRCDCYSLDYGDLDSAIRCIDELTADGTA